MRLKSIKLVGFKSFVDPTVAHFPTNLSAVVGPNGCGKSNIIDAVRWVMGESSAKNLRGENMTDVIFNGSTARKPVGQASIELVFDNSDATLGGEYAEFAEISIKRLVTREAKSDYFLNGVRCRRKDITDIFLGTGLGPRSYAIIEQGMISRLIEAKPEELRVYIEEAAGISKYKERRRETETRMRHTRENLDRLSDIRDELEKQLAHLQRQAQSAEKYKEYKEEERLLKAQLHAIRWQVLNTQVGQRETLIRELEIRLEAVIAEQRAADAALEKQREGQIELSDKFAEVQSRFYRIGNEISRIEQSMGHQRERLSQLKNDLAQAERSQQQTGEHLQLDEAQLEDVRAQMLTLEPELAMLQAQSDELASGLATAEERMQRWQAEWEQFNQGAATARQQAEVEQSRIQHLEQAVQRSRERVERLEAERKSLVAGPLADEVAVLNEQISEVELELEAAQEKSDATAAGISSQRDRNNQLHNECDGLKSRQQALKGREASLFALQQAALGQTGGVLAWLEGQGLSDQPRLADKLQVHDGWERAVETVLGPHLQAVCVESLDAISSKMAGLGKGSVTLLEARAVTSATDLTGTPLASYVHSLEASSLLAGVYACAELADAMELREHLKPHESVVTRDGIWLGPNWLRVIREDDAESGVLARKQELARVVAELDEIEAILGERQEELDSGREGLRALELQREDVQRELSQLNRRRGDVQAQLGAKQVRLEQFNARSSRIEKEMEDVQAQQRLDQEQVSEARLVLEEALEVMGRDAARRDELLRERDLAREALDQARQKTRADRDAAHQVALTMQALRTRETSLAQSISRLQEQLAQFIERRETLQESLLELENPGGEYQLQLEELLGQRVAVETELADVRRDLEAVQHEFREHERKRQQAEQQAQQVRDMLQTQRMEWQNAMSRRESLKEQLLEAQFDLETVLANLPEDASEGPWQEDLEKVTARITRLGPINLAAIDEYQAQSERKNYLDAQDADLREALETLENAIRKIDRETRTLFKDTFDRVNKGLQELFPKVFGGGHAYLELTGEDLLEAGVAIMARPPGKRNSTIHLLSGGEKALTALALVFSIFALNPAPFCMLDEVDAPLDDANVGRYARLVEEMSERVQFIYITHNKLAMEMAHQLMGVTMHEPGVSRLVSVNVEEAAALAAV
ncbi:MAG: chromosome segregation protein [Moraxellaceae bacterium]|jgi:chromosome segregation protein|nr:chromosome segregation protein [Moraxellaceae bacterium]